MASPNGSRACQPIVQSPNVNLSAGVGINDMVNLLIILFGSRPNLPLPLPLIYIPAGVVKWQTRRS